MIRIKARKMWRNAYFKKKDFILVDRYKISSHGDIYDRKKKKIMKQNTDEQGYKRVGLKFINSNGETKWYTVRIHQLVSVTFLDNDCNNYKIPNHLDGQKSNNHYLNLELTNHSGNTTHAYQNNLIEKQYGENNHFSIYSNDFIDMICKTLSEYPRYPHYYICKMLDIEYTDAVSDLLHKIECGKTHVLYKNNYNLEKGNRYICRGFDDSWINIEHVCLLLSKGEYDTDKLIKLSGMVDDRNNRNIIRHIKNRTGFKSITRYFKY